MQPDLHTKPDTAEISAAGPVDGMGDYAPAGSYLRIRIATREVEQFHRISRGAAEVLMAELWGVLTNGKGMPPLPWRCACGATVTAWGEPLLSGARRCPACGVDAPDLVGRLKARSEGRELNGPLFMADMAEAAAEIEKLRGGCQS